MRLLIGLAVVGALAASAGAATDTERRVARAGVSVSLPGGWQVLDKRLTPCINPTERLVVRGKGALVMIQEGLRPLFRARQFELRPARFALRGEPTPLECCAPAPRAGWLFSFRDKGRGFYVYAYAGGAGTRVQVLDILNSLRVKPAAT
jgi:hypothetical protein